MDSLLTNPSFSAYAIATVVLSANLIFLWAWSGAVRAKSGAAINPEDAERVKAPLAEIDPPGVARVLRAHANAQALIYPFLFAGLVFVLAGGGATMARVLFGWFTVARLLHSFVYLKALQPWRTICFVLSGIPLIILLGQIVWMVIQH